MIPEQRDRLNTKKCPFVSIAGAERAFLRRHNNHFVLCYSSARPATVALKVPMKASAALDK